jgi:site-specific DNA recombinase
VPTLRILLRRSKDEGQEFSLDVQRQGCWGFATKVLPSRQPPVVWEGHHEYIDDGIAGDDFLGRAALHRLVREVQRGDVIVCRDHSRLGRDALESLIAIRELVQRRGARLFYYISGTEVFLNSAIDVATNCIQGVGAQMELENVRSRTREALRSRVLAGRSAGCKIYGYSNKRMKDDQGRGYTLVEVFDEEAGVVRRIFNWYVVEGWGLKRIAVKLNKDHIPSPSAGKRGTGSWAPSCIRSILRNERYRGVYIHGRILRKKEEGKRKTYKGDPAQMIVHPMPEWQIIDDATWSAAQERMRERGEKAPAPGPASKYPLSGIAKCGVCGGSIGVRRGWASGTGNWVQVYGCTWHHVRGKAVCAVRTIQPVEEVEGALARYLQDTILTPMLVEKVTAAIKAEVEAQLANAPADTHAVEVELEKTRSQVRKLVRLGALTDEADLPELAAELRRLNERGRRLETDLRTAQRLPEQVHGLMAKVEASARQKLEDLRTALAGDREGAREVFLALFPDGLTFLPAEGEGRRTFAVSGQACLDVSKLSCDPSGIRTRVTGVKGQRPRPTRRWGLRFVSPAGVEPATNGLKVRCSTN